MFPTSTDTQLGEVVFPTSFWGVTAVLKRQSTSSIGIQRELQLQSKQLRFLSWAIPVATAFLALMMVALGIVFAIFGAG